MPQLRPSAVKWIKNQVPFFPFLCLHLPVLKKLFPPMQVCCRVFFYFFSVLRVKSKCFPKITFVITGRIFFWTYILLPLGTVSTIRVGRFQRPHRYFPRLFPSQLTEVSAAQICPGAGCAGFHLKLQVQWFATVGCLPFPPTLLFGALHLPQSGISWSHFAYFM